MLTQLRPAMLNRYRQIASILGRHGLSFALSYLGLDRFAAFNPLRRNHAARPETVRKCLEDLGTTFVKLGQMLSTRPDLLPADYQGELAKLQDQVKPVETEVIKQLVVEELGRPIESVFASFDEAPMAAASIGQVHGATLHDGTEVAVKVRRPGVVQQVNLDLEILGSLADNATRVWNLGGQYDLPELVEEFGYQLKAELDYRNEARNIERMAANFKPDHGIHFPRVYWEGTTSGIITMERLHGIKVSDGASLDAADIDRPAVAQRAAGALLKMIFEDGFFHADPHPGNFFIEPDGVVGLIDFGTCVSLDDTTRDQLVDAAIAGAGQDPDRVVDSILEMGFAKHDVDRDVLRRDLTRLRAQYVNRPLSEIPIREVYGDAMALARRHHLQIPASIANLAKTLTMAEGIGRRLYSQFNLVEVLQPYASRLVRLKYSPVRRAKQLAQAGLDAAWLATELPRKLRRILNNIERGGLGVRLEGQTMDTIHHRLEAIGLRLMVGIIAAGFLIVMAILVSSSDNESLSKWEGPMFVSAFVYIVSVGLWLTWKLLRGRRD